MDPRGPRFPPANLVLTPAQGSPLAELPQEDAVPFPEGRRAEPRRAPRPLASIKQIWGALGLIGGILSFGVAAGIYSARLVTTETLHDELVPIVDRLAKLEGVLSKGQERDREGESRMVGEAAQRAAELTLRGAKEALSPRGKRP